MISLSIVATETSTLTLVGVPAIAFSTYARPEQGGNLTYLQVVVGYMVARVLISVLFIPAYFAGQMLTAYELLNRRFGPLVKHVDGLAVPHHAAARRGRARVCGLAGVERRSFPRACRALPHLWLWSIVSSAG